MQASALREAASASKEAVGPSMASTREASAEASMTDWMKATLAAERASLTAFMEKRHEALLVEVAEKEAMSCARTGHSRGSSPVGPVPADNLPGLLPESPKVNELPSLPQKKEPLVFILPTSATSHELKDPSDQSSLHDDPPIEKVSGKPAPPPYPEAWSTTERSDERSDEAGDDEPVDESPSQKARESGMARNLTFLDSGSAMPLNSVQSVLRFIATHPAVELIVTTLIMANAVIIAFDIQYKGLQLGYELGYRRYSHSSQEAWAGAELAFEVLDYFFGIVFTAELIIKVVGLQRQWLRDYWNMFDALIVGFWLIEKLPREAVSMPDNSNLLRAARMFRLVRLIRVIRTLQGFDSLYLLMTTLKGCLWILGWSTIFLYCIQMLIAFMMCFILNETYFNRDDVPEKEKLEVFEYFGSFSRAMLSMFELTLANWPPVCRLLVENVSEWFMIFFIAHKLTIGFAIIGVINGVFMQETFRVASTDDRIMVRQRERDLKVHTAKMSKLFSAADSSGDGEIDLDEFLEILKDPDIVLWLASMEITVRDPESFFELLDVDGDGSLTPDEVVKGCLKMRGGAKSVDVLGLRKDVTFIKQCLYREFGVTSRTLGRLSPASGG